MDDPGKTQPYGQKPSPARREATGARLPEAATTQADAPALGAAHVVCTVAEGAYFNGVAALINSLVAAGFRGDVVVAYRGALPDWVGALAPDAGTDTRAVAPGVRLRTIPLPGAWHLGNLRPQLIVDIFARTRAELVFYFDTDIVVTGPWDAFARWAANGIVAALDVADSFMPANHAFRHEWRRLAATKGYACAETTGYFNSGCVGIGRAHADFAAVWRDLMLALEVEGADMRTLKDSSGKVEFSRMDQDMLNIAIMAAGAPISALGYESMGLYPRANQMMAHAMFYKKPWCRPYILDALRGIPPGQSHLAYWRHIDGPIQPFSPLSRRLRRVEVAIARFIGLLHVRDSRDL